MFVQGVRVRCYIEDNGIRIHRMDDAVYQTYDFAQGRWVHSTEIMDMFIGELWADEVSEAEADVFIAKKAHEFGSHGSSDGAARREDPPARPHAPSLLFSDGLYERTLSPFGRRIFLKREPKDRDK